MSSSLMSCTWFLLHVNYGLKTGFKFVSSVLPIKSLLWQCGRKTWTLEGLSFCRYETHLGVIHFQSDKYVAPSEYLSIDEILYPIKNQLPFRHYDPKKLHRYRLVLWKSLNDAGFSYAYKSVPYAVKPKTGDGPHCIKATIDYAHVYVYVYVCFIWIWRDIALYRYIV